MPGTFSFHPEQLFMPYRGRSSTYVKFYSKEFYESEISANYPWLGSRVARLKSCRSQNCLNSRNLVLIVQANNSLS